MSMHQADSRTPTLAAIVNSKLSAKHLADLRSSGLSDDTIITAGFWTERDPEKINILLNRRDGARLGEVLCIPYPINANTEYMRTKPDNPPASTKDRKTAKYLAPSKTPIRLYSSPNFHTDVARIEQRIIITEGEKKCLSLWQLGEPTIGLPGVECWSSPRVIDQAGHKTGPRQLHADLEKIDWSKRVVYIAFDSDVVVKPGVRAAEQALANVLTGAGATVYLFRIPHPQGDTKCGIDDFLVQQENPSIALANLLATAIKILPPIQKMGQYGVQENSLFHEKLTREGVVRVPLCNFDARIIEEIMFDDGVTQRREHVIEGRHQSGELLPRSIVSAEEFTAMNWPLKQWGALANVYAGFGNKDHARCAIQALSVPTKKVVFTHVGWRVIDGVPHYLHAGGAINAQGHRGDIACQLPFPLRGYCLPTPPTGDTLRQAIRESLDLVHKGLDDRITFPLLAAIFRAPLGMCDFALFLAGLTGTFKTELSALALQHFGPTMNARNLPANWASTGNAIEALAFSAKDTLLIIDDFAPSGSANDVQRLQREAERIFRAQGNNAGRLRMQADTTLREERPPRGLILSTGEDVPRAHSIRARLVVLDIRRGDIPSATLTAMQATATKGKYASAMAGYIRYLAQHYEAVQNDFDTKRGVLRTEFTKGNSHARTPSAIADLALGLHHLLAFALDTEAITKKERDEFWQRGRTAFRELISAQAEHHEAANPVDQFVGLIQSALANGRAHLAGEDGNVPNINPRALGWRTHLHPNTMQPCGTLIGWMNVEKNCIYLDPNSALAVVQQFAELQGQTFALTHSMLARHLHERGLLARITETGGKKRYKVRVQLAGARREVWCIALATLLPDFGAPSASKDESLDETEPEPARTSIELSPQSGEATKEVHQNDTDEHNEALTTVPTLPAISTEQEWSDWQ